MSNSIKFTPAGGKVTVLLKIISIADINVDCQVVTPTKPEEEAKMNKSEWINSVPDKTDGESSEEYLTA